MMSGFLLVDKPSGVSSFTAVRKARRALHVRKAGHTGTLDPAATGLLIIAFGQATRLIEFVPSQPKTYEFSIQFGRETDTLDREGKVIRSGGRIPDRSELTSILPEFQGTIRQIPPVFSAIKMQGQRSYRLARNGTPRTPPSREVTIHSIECTDFNTTTGTASFTTACSGGTYVRSLARDIAQRCNTHGYAAHIRRTGIGSITVSDAIGLEDIHPKHTVTIYAMFQNRPCCTLKPDATTIVERGGAIDCSGDFPTGDTFFAFDEQKRWVAVLKTDCQTKMLTPMKTRGERTRSDGSFT